MLTGALGIMEVVFSMVDLFFFASLALSNGYNLCLGILHWEKLHC